MIDEFHNSTPLRCDWTEKLRISGKTNLLKKIMPFTPLGVKT